MPYRLPPAFQTTTANAFDGYRVAQTIGVVRGIKVRSRSIVGLIGVRFQQLLGGDITLLTSLCERARADAFEAMVEHARSVGANALLAVRYDAAEIMPGVSEVLCYGTAVLLEAVDDRNA